MTYTYINPILTVYENQKISVTENHVKQCVPANQGNNLRNL